MNGSLLPPGTIKAIAQTIGIEDLDDGIASALASDVEYRIREIAQEAIKFMRHSKRDILTAEDVNNALRLRKVEALYGFSSENSIKFTRAAGTTDLYYVEDPELEFNDIINAPLPKCTRETTLTAHWLAVEGVQPAIPQNPTLSYNTDPGGGVQDASSGGGASVPVEVKPLVKHVLSKELQLYYEKIVMAITSSKNVQGENDLLQAALKSLSTDPGINPLLPYFVQMISDQITYNIHNLPLLKALIRVMRALLDNPNLHVDPYLHQMIPSILTCLVGRRLCENPSDNHWELRDYSATLIASICERVGNTYQNLQPRITKTLLHALLDLTKSLTTHYGAIKGLSALGPRVIELLVLPNLKSYMGLLERATESENPLKRVEATKCYGALLEAAGIYLQHTFKTAVPRQPIERTAEAKGEEGKGKGKQKENTQRDEPALGVAFYEELHDLFGEAIETFVPRVAPEDDVAFL